METIGERIKRLRKEKKMTQSQLGEFLGVEKSAVASGSFSVYK